MKKLTKHLIEQGIKRVLDNPESYGLGKLGEQKPDTNCLLSWSEADEKMFQSLESIVKDYWVKAEQEKNEIKIREASDVSYFLETIQKSPLCWIKCSDGLPNRDGTYLVVTDGSHNEVYDMARYDFIEGWHKASEIIYWMPIPQLNNKSIIEQKSVGEEIVEALRTEYEKGRADAIAQMQKEWSDEDEKIVSEVIQNYESGFLPSVIERDRIVKTLKSLKDRVQPQPKQEWSEEDEKMFEYALDMIEWYSGKNENKSRAVSNWLKSLKDRVQPQNWTKEDKERYISCLKRLSTGNPEQPETINSKWFKEHVYPQTTWKPSDEQLEAVKRASNGSRAIAGNDYLIMESLYNNLKKLKGE